MILLAILMVLTPIGVVNVWPRWLTTGILPAAIVLLLLAGQTAVFPLRRCPWTDACDAAAARRLSFNVGQLEDAAVEQRVRDPRQTPSPGMRQ